MDFQELWNSSLNQISPVIHKQTLNCFISYASYVKILSHENKKKLKVINRPPVNILG